MKEARLKTLSTLYEWGQENALGSEGEYVQRYVREIWGTVELFDLHRVGGCYTCTKAHVIMYQKR